METCRVTFFPNLRAATAAGIACLAALAGCSSIEGMLGGEKVDYRSTSTKSTAGLEVPPDLTQLAKDTRYQPSSGVVSASTFQTAPATPGAPVAAAASAPAPTAPTLLAAAAAATATPTIAPSAVGAFKIERLGNDRWLSTTLTPEQVFPQVRTFWKDNGFNLAQDRPEAGVIETEWAENRAKLPQDIIRGTLGKLVESVYSTGELDRFRTRLERTPNGTEIFVSHRGMEEVYTGSRRESTAWQPRASDPALEAEFLRRLMVKLGVSQEQSKALAASATEAGQPSARVANVGGQPVVQISDGFERAWRRVGLALDRTGFTVEDRDRAAGTYFVRYVTPNPDKAEQGFLGKLLNIGGSSKNEKPLKFRIVVKSQGEASTVAVQNEAGAPESSANAQRIVQVISDDLK